jgi:predicted PurR-regulated permease PerM
MSQRPSTPATLPDGVPAVRSGMALVFGAAIVAGVIWLALTALGVLVLLFVAILLASALGPVVDSLRARLPIGRSAAILVVYAAFLALTIGFAFIAVPTALHQMDALAHRLQPFIDQAQAWADRLRPVALSSSVDALIDAARHAITPPATARPDQVIAIGSAVAGAVVTVATLVTLVFFWLTEHARLQRYVLAFLPMERRGGARRAWDDVELRLGLWVQGQLTVMAAVGIATGTLYTILGLPSALLLGMFAGLAEAIPLVGPIIGAIPAILVALTVGPETAALVLVADVVIQFVEGNILVPRVMRRTVRISSFLVVASLLIGGAVGGLLGAFLAVPVVAAGEVILQRLQAREVPVTQAPLASDDDAATAPDDAAGGAANASSGPRTKPRGGRFVGPTVEPGG